MSENNNSKVLILVGCTGSKEKEINFLAVKKRYLGKGKWFQEDLQKLLFQATSVKDADWRVITKYPEGKFSSESSKVEEGYYVLEPDDQIQYYDKDKKKYDEEWLKKAFPIVKSLIEKNQYKKVVVLTSVSSWRKETKTKFIEELHSHPHSCQVSFPVPVAVKGNRLPVRSWLKEQNSKRLSNNFWWNLKNET